jgi:hypothetical protein
MKSLFLFLMLTHGVNTQSPYDASIIFGSPTQEAKWVKAPTIVICKDAPVKQSRVEEAVGFWRSMGYNIGEIIVAGPDDFGCIQDFALNGEILITLVGQDFNMSQHLGLTKTFYNKHSREILKAKIYLMSGWGNTERILEHEIGHALGWKDYNQTGHVMHAHWSRGGHQTRGLEKK